MYIGILRQIRGLLYLVWGAKDGYLCDLRGNCHENDNFDCLLNQIMDFLNVCCSFSGALCCIV